MAARSAALVLAVLGAATGAAAKDSYPPLEVLLQSSVTDIGQPFEYPDGQARITAVTVTMEPGQQTGWHVHQVPMYAQILDGELTVDYGPDGKRTLKAGDSIVEAFRSRHKGVNTGTVPVKILVVFAGAEGVANTVSEDQ